tara:strand:- start:273 stop:467 length:195 start_codon:yes stop_codon:yes gene_type:complete
MSKPTAATVHTELIRHETECAERWKTNFKHLEKMDTDISFIKRWMLAGLFTISMTLLSFVLSTI